MVGDWGPDWGPRHKSDPGVHTSGPRDQEPWLRLMAGVWRGRAERSSGRRSLTLVIIKSEKYICKKIGHFDT